MLDADEHAYRTEMKKMHMAVLIFGVKYLALKCTSQLQGKKSWGATDDNLS